MTVRDPYTGAEKKASPSRSFRERWWPALLILAIFVAAGYFEWQRAAPSGGRLDAAPSPPAIAIQPATPHIASNDALTRATTALAAATEQLARDAKLLIAIAALQLLVLAGQLYLFDRQRRAARAARRDAL